MGQLFENIAVGDQLVIGSGHHYVVTDRWFDPVRGFRKPASGEMVAIRRVNWAGVISGRKIGHTLRGLATQGYRPAETDYISLAKARWEATQSGTVSHISHGHAIRRRPKLAGL